MESRQNNFDFLRLLFSSLVVFSHSFPLTGTPEPLYEFSGRQIDLGALSVNIFFAMSGHLVFFSYQNSTTALNYLWKRCLRIFPALFVLLLLSMMLFPFFYEGHQSGIFSERQYWMYFPNNLSLYRFQETIAGVFENNLRPQSVNSSLWSLKYEFTMYLVLFFIFYFRKLKFKYILILSAFIGSWYFHAVRPGMFEVFFGNIEFKSALFFRTATYFFAGSLLTCFDLKKINFAWVKISLVIISIAAILTGHFTIIAPLTIPLLVILIGISYNKYLQKITDFTGDLSYGIYIYGFLIQQSIMYFIPLNTLLLFISSYLITCFFAYFSWNFVEKKTMKYKTFFS